MVDTPATVKPWVGATVWYYEPDPTEPGGGYGPLAALVTHVNHTTGNVRLLVWSDGIWPEAEFVRTDVRQNTPGLFAPRTWCWPRSV